MSNQQRPLYSFRPIVPPTDAQKTADLNEALRQIADTLINIQRQLDAIEARLEILEP